MHIAGEDAVLDQHLVLRERTFVIHKDRYGRQIAKGSMSNIHQADLLAGDLLAEHWSAHRAGFNKIRLHGMPNGFMRQDAGQVRIEDNGLDARLGIHTLSLQDQLLVLVFELAEQVFGVRELGQEVAIAAQNLIVLHGLPIFILGGHKNINIGSGHIRVRDDTIAGVEQFFHVEHAGEDPPAEQLGETLGDVAVELVDDAQ